MPNLEDVKAALVKLENGQSLYDVVADAIASAKQDRKSQVADLETKNGAFLSVLRELGYDPEHADKDFAKNLKAKLEAGSQAGEKLTAEQKRMKDLESTVADLSKKYSESETGRQKAEAARKNAIAKDLLMGKLKGKIYGASAHAESLISSGAVSIGQDDKTLVWKDMDDFEKGLTSFFETNKEDLVNIQNPGPGAGNRSGGKPTGKTMARSEYESLDQPSRSKFFKDGGEIVD